MWKTPRGEGEVRGVNGCGVERAPRREQRKSVVRRGGDQRRERRRKVIGEGGTRSEERKTKMRDAMEPYLDDGEVRK